MHSLSRFLSLAGVLSMGALMASCGSAQSREARYIQHGKAYFAAGNYDKARVEFGNAAQIDPKDATVRYLLGQVAEKLGDERGAVGQYQAAIDQDPKQSGARAALGRIYLYAGLPDRALQLAEPGLAANPDDAQLLTVRGAARARLGNGQQAMEDAQRAVRLAPADEYAVALLSSLYRQSSQLPQAIAVVLTGLQHVPRSVDLRVILADLYIAGRRPADAEAELKQIVALQPRNAANRYRLARFYVQQKNIDAAEQVLRAAVSAEPKDVYAKLQLVEFLAAQRGRVRAIAETNEFTAREPDNDSLKLGLGQFLAGLGQTDDAERDLRAVVAHDDTGPAGLTARDRLAALALARHDSAAAGTLLAQVLQKNSTDADALFMRGDIAMERGDTADAITDLRTILRDQPNAVAVMRALAQAYVQGGDIALAEQTLRTAVQVAPADPANRMDLARVLVSDGKSDQAEPLLEQLAKEDPSSVLVQQSLFQAQATLEHNAQARLTAQTLQHAVPQRALGFYMEGLIDESDGKSDAAFAHYEKALQLEPNAAEPLTALVRLDLQRHQPAAALARVNAVLARSPTNAVARDLAGGVLLAEGQTAAALAAMQATLQIAPAWVHGYHSLAMAQLAAKRNDDAIATLQLGLQRTQQANGLLADLSNLYERLGRPDDAIRLYQGVLAHTPNSIFAANNLAMLLVTYRQDAASLAQAQKLGDQLAALTNATVIDTRGWVKFKSGDYHSAESLLQEAVDKSPDAPELRFHLGMAQFRSGEAQAAQQNLESALHSTHPFADIQQARATLAQLQKTTSSG